MSDRQEHWEFLQEAWRALNHEWEDTRSLWDDSVSARFESEVWSEFRDAVPPAIRDLERLAEVIFQARREIG